MSRPDLSPTIFSLKCFDLTSPLELTDTFDRVLLVLLLVGIPFVDVDILDDDRLPLASFPEPFCDADSGDTAFSTLTIQPITTNLYPTNDL